MLIGTFLPWVVGRHFEVVAHDDGPLTGDLPRTGRRKRVSLIS